MILVTTLVIERILKSWHIAQELVTTAKVHAQDAKATVSNGHIISHCMYMFYISKN